ncbi:hypothetical protein JKP88DRAFT_284404 [Tribonema minus]|uniref:ParB/Sulfiredoxin domain-containing protein n=1 Tax=Tribonema minus TaxID=303371 RepID=A0A836CMX8_9STRA|nr:hypothetical protein JKP88DRAFT_284404 [Tribonema minus]
MEALRLTEHARPLHKEDLDPMAEELLTNGYVEALSSIVVVPRDGDSYAVIDSNHRVAAMRRTNVRQVMQSSTWQAAKRVLSSRDYAFFTALLPRASI